jgi:hypothetical protein
MQAGRVVLWVLLVLAGTGLSALVLTLGRTTEEGSGTSAAENRLPEGGLLIHQPAELLPAMAPEERGRTLAGGGAPELPGPAPGKLVGRLEFGPGVTEPVSWQLLVLDWTGDLVRTESFRGSEQRFELALPPGDYSVRAEAQAVGSQPASVHVERGRSTEPLTLVLSGLAALSGSVRDESGAPVAGLPVFLRDPRGLAATVETDPDGDFALPPLPGGRYELLLGAQEAPIVASLPVDLAEPVQELEPQVVPVLGWVELTVLDGAGRPAPLASFSGSGNRGGLLEGETDAQGRATVRLLPPGMYRVVASHPTLGRASEVFPLGGGEGSQVELVLRPGTPGS